MKILLVINKLNREMVIMQAIKEQIVNINPAAIVEIVPMFPSGFSFNRYVLKYRPNVILTFPFTCEGFSDWFYIFKYFLGCKVITYRAEGVIDFNSEFNLGWAVGLDKYGSNLVDYEVFWGEKLASAVGRVLFDQGKISSLDRIKVAGYPRLESYVCNNSIPNNSIPERVAGALSKFPKKKTMLFLTGFQLANYTRENIIDAKDLVAKDDKNGDSKINQILDSVEMAGQFRKKWIEKVIEIAKNNPEILIISKKHPIEKKDDYNLFGGIENILYVHEDVQVNDVIGYAGICFHYGSTALVDSYLSNIPSVYVHTEESVRWYPDLGWPSTMKSHLDNVHLVVKDYLAGRVGFKLTPGMNIVLKDMFNISDIGDYKPSRDIAAVIMDADPPQRTGLLDRFFWRAAGRVIIIRIKNILAAKLAK